jgi:hypothetical protein
LIPIFTQTETAVNAITETVSNAIDAGTVGIAVLLAAGLLLLGGLMGLLIWKVIVPLLKQAVDMSSQVGKLIERTNGAIEHSNTTNTLQTEATNVQTGEIRLLRTDFRNYQTLQSDTLSALVERFNTFDNQLAKIDGLKLLIETSHGDHADIKGLLTQMVESMKSMHDDIRFLIPAPPQPPTQIELTVKPSQPDAPPEAADLPKAS